MNISIVVNTYIDVDKNLKNPFDHPTDFENFDKENTLCKTIESISKLNVSSDDNLRIIIFAVATQENTVFDSEIRKKIYNYVSDLPYEVLIYTNSDIIKFNESFNSCFLSVAGYPEIRNLGFIFPIILGDDVIIQIDDDELLRPEYITKTKEILISNPDKFLFTAPYEKNGTVRIKTEDTLKSWKKFSSMAEDIEDFYFDSKQIKETIFGFGGNMIIRREFAENIFYPLNVPRGEDFSMLLVSRLIYENGNRYANIKEHNEKLKAYFAPYEEITIIHEPPHEPRADFLRYFENNMKRFIMEWGVFIKQEKLTIGKLKELSKYIYEMIGYEDMKTYLDILVTEMKTIYEENRIDFIYKELTEDIEFYKKTDRFEEYKKIQNEYIQFIKEISTDHWQKQIICLGENNGI